MDKAKALKVLGLKEGVGPDEIKKAYKRMATQHHPDKSNGSEAKIREINHAHQFLTGNANSMLPTISNKDELHLLNPKFTIRTHLNEQCYKISESKMRLYLLKYGNYTSKKVSAIVSPFTFVGILLATLTSDFKDVVFEASVWKALFVLLSIGTFLWMVYSVAYIFLSNKKKFDTDDFIQWLENNCDEKQDNSNDN